MKTEIFKINPFDIDEEIIKYCGEKLRNGSLVCFPTETVYGLGANAFNAEAVNNIFKAKGRPQDNPLIVHISSFDMINSVTQCTPSEKLLMDKLAERFWPGPLTMIAEKSPEIPENVTCGLKSVGVRYPSHKIAVKLIESSGVPVAAPSANISGKPSPTKASHVIEDLDGRVDIIIDGGDSSVGVESTVLDITSFPPCILRPGYVTQQDISEIILDVSEFVWKKDVEKPRSPGMKYKHYSPKATVTLFKGNEQDVSRRILNEINRAKQQGLKAGVLATDQTICYYIDNITLSLGNKGNLSEQATRLYDCLRKCDEMGLDVVFAEAVSENGVGDAIMNRLYRAAGGRLIDVRSN